MNKDEMQSMIQELLANMTSGEKMKMMMDMMGKLKEGINMEEMMSKMRSMEGPGGMKEMMSKMKQGGEEHEAMMPEMMLKGMMPHCIKMMMPSISKDKRTDLVLGMISTLMEQASDGMSDDEKAALRAKVSAAINA